MPSIADNITFFVEQMQREATAIGRDPEGIRLICVSKTFPQAAIRAAHAAGQSTFGENYLQEALDKQAQLADLPLEWHFIGQIQSNKTAPIAAGFDWVHGVDRSKIARRLAEQRPAELPPVNICLQVNISNEPGKGGIAPDIEGLLELAQQVLQHDRLRLRGLMAVPAAGVEAEAQFAQMQQLYQRLQEESDDVDTLSMGMSGDWPLALQYGANMIRIGRAIFGERTYDAGRKA